MASPPSKLQRTALYAGGFLGPFGGMMTATILPELGESYGIQPDQAAASIMFYLLPFATTMLISSSLGARWGVRRMILIAYATICPAAILCAMAPTWPVFLLGYTVLGVSNAFTTPLILSLFSSFTSPDRLGRTLGLYGAVNAVGQLSAPLLSGVLAEFSWRYTFVCVAGFAVVLCVIGVPRILEQRKERARVRFSWALVWLCVTNLSVGACVTGLGFLVALLAFERFESSSAERGIILMVGGVAALVLAPATGAIVDRWGSHRVLVASLFISALSVALMPWAPNGPILGALWGCATAAGLAAWLGVNKYVLGSPSSRDALSSVQAFRFFGAGLAPMVFLPIYVSESGWGFLVPALLILATLAVNAVFRPTSTS
ncbi:MFS transporter [Diaminobutyricimonas sp. TR449]|uniref:MFS transporter n=1 Tax=Diaminobutyricimonas sp. TR449 TaxID=2708076 RepID=UPI002444D845|nr:MFS transporter [Diaminobutyricimonas sp. TR449]